jgi:hypothetical protein
MPIARNDKGETLRLDDNGQWVPTQTATNPTSGETLAFDGKSWVPFGQKPAEPSALESAVGYASGLAKSVGQGLTVGFMDEIDAGVNAPFIAAKRALVDGEPFDMSKAYGDRLNQYREGLTEFRESNPATAFTSEVGGAVAGTMATPLRALGAASQGASTLAQMGRGALAGGALGGLYGYGSAEGGPENRAIGAATGAAVGGVVGAAAPAVIQGVRKAGQFVADKTINRLPFRQAGAAERKVAEALMRDGFTPEQAAAKIKSMGPEAALMDAGPNSQALARAAYTVPGEGKTKIGEKLIARQEGARGANNELVGGQINRITQNLDDIVTPEQFTATQRRILETTRSDAARPTYESVVNNAQNLIPDEKFAAVGSDPYIKGVIKRVKSNKLFGMADLPDNSMPVVDATKKQLDDLIGAAQRAGRKNEARMLMGKKEALVGVADEAFPDYKMVREVWSDFSGVIDAGDLGRKFMRGEVDSLKDAVSRMSDAERHQFRVGVVQGLRDKVGSLVTRADATKKMMDVPSLEKKIQVAFGDEAVFKNYIDMLKNERTMFDTYGKIMGGSRTAEVLAEQADVGVDKGRIAQGVASIVNPASPTGFVRGIADVAGGLRDRAAMTGPMSRNLGEILTGQDVARLNTAMESAQLSAAQREVITRVLQGTGAVGGGRISPQGQ